MIEEKRGQYKGKVIGRTDSSSVWLVLKMEASYFLPVDVVGRHVTYV